MSIWIQIGFGRGGRLVTRRELKALESKMAKTIDDLNALKTDLDAAVARINEDTTNFTASIQTLKDQVAALQAQIGETTPEVQALIDGLRATIVGLDPDPSNPPVVPTPEPTP